MTRSEKLFLIKKAIEESFYSPPWWEFYGPIKRTKGTKDCTTYRVMIESKQTPGLLFLYEVEVFEWADTAFAWFQGTYKEV